MQSARFLYGKTPDEVDERYRELVPAEDVNAVRNLFEEIGYLMRRGAHDGSH